LTGIKERAHPNQVTEDWVGDKPYLVIVDTGTFATAAKPDIAARWPERQPHQRYTLQIVHGKALPTLKEAFLTMTLGRRPLKIWVLVANITNEFILGLDILRTYDASVDLGRQSCVFQRKGKRYEGPRRDPGLPVW
jgi:hypothetical protein